MTDEPTVQRYATKYPCVTLRRYGTRRKATWSVWLVVDHQSFAIG